MKFIDIFESIVQESNWNNAQENAIRPIVTTIERFNTATSNANSGISIEYGGHFAERCHERMISANEIGIFLQHVLKIFLAMSPDKREHQINSTIDFLDSVSGLYMPIIVKRSGKNMELNLKTFYAVNHVSSATYTLTTNLPDRTKSNDPASMSEKGLVKIGRSYNDGWDGS